MKPIFSEQADWQGRGYSVELFECQKIPDVSPIKQVQAICFAEENKIVLYEHVDQWFGLPGGTIEPNETIAETLKRELLEEASVKLKTWEPIAYEKIWWLDSPDDLYYFLRCKATVDLLNIPVNDPDKKSMGRIIVDPEEAIKKLGYGEKGKIIINLALKLIE